MKMNSNKQHKWAWECQAVSRQDSPQSNLTEGLEKGDLARLVMPKVTVDEYKSKMGSDEDIVVVSFQVRSKEPALDLVNFLEKSYDWVIDSDLSSGELFDGSYVVFVEIERDADLGENLISMFTDLENLTDFKLDDWRLVYFKTKKVVEMSVEGINSAMPTSPEAYNKLFKKDKEDLDKLKTAAGVPVTTKAPQNDMTENIRILAGII
jgi:hypothetical protein